jgi:hypothetical protein
MADRGVRNSGLLLATIQLSQIREGVFSMSATPHDKQQPADVIEAIVPFMPIVLPIMGGALILLLAFIAVYVA